MKTHTLQFKKNTDIHPGLNLTVRNGSKWHDTCKPGDGVDVVETGKESVVVCRGRVLFTALRPFGTIPSFWLEYEHNPACREIAGLVDGMKRAYGDEWNPETAMVTCLFFTV